MYRPIASLAVPALAVAALAGCGSSSHSSSTATSTAQPTASPSAAVAVTSSPIGQMLVDSSGRSLYEFQKDKAGKSSCTSGCAAVWPPLTASGAPKAGPGVVAAKLTTNASGQVVYNGHPLYRFSGDHASGDMNGQGLHSFGGGWYVVSPAGSQINRPKPSGGASSGSSSSSSGMSSGGGYSTGGGGYGNGY